MVTDNGINQKIMARAPAGEILSAAHQAGMKLLRQDGWDKVRQGITTPEEVMRVSN